MWNAYIYTLYGPLINESDYKWQLFSTVTRSPMILINMTFWLFSIIIWLVAPYMAVAVREHVFCDMTNFEPAVDI